MHSWLYDITLCLLLYSVSSKQIWFFVFVLADPKFYSRVS